MIPCSTGIMITIITIRLFLLLSYLYKNPQLIIDNDDDICPPNILLKELCCFFINERDLGKEIYLCKEEMICG